jgi:hypothetical protein
MTHRHGTSRIASIAALTGAVLAGWGLAPSPAHATTTLAALVFNPVPIGQSTNTATSKQVTITLTADDANKQPIPNEPVYLSFHQAPAGGTAVAGGRVLGVKAVQLTTNSSGQIAIVYTTPSKFPSTGSDLLRAQNGATVAQSTIKSGDQFCYSSISGMGFTPEPIAPAGSLHGKVTVPVTLTVLGPTGSPAPGATVYLVFHPAAGGGTAMVGTTSIGSQPQAFVTDSNGQLSINYTTPTTTPKSGRDALSAANEASSACETAWDGYTYG